MNGKDKITKMNNMEIKVGDKVRVREDAPKIYTEGWSCDWLHAHSNVRKTEGDSAEIELDCYALVIPTKYLVKVDDEVKEPKFKRGDKVVSKPPFVEKVWTVFGYDDKMPYMVRVGDGEYINERNLEPYTEPTEQTEAKKKPYDGISEETANEISNMLEAYAKALSGIADSFDWQRYEADLAKEIVLKTVNSASDQRPMSIADYAVSVAKAVVEGLKRK